MNAIISIRKAWTGVCAVSGTTVGRFVPDRIGSWLNLWIIHVHSPIQRNTGEKVCDSHWNPRTVRWPCEEWTAAYRREQRRQLGDAAWTRGSVLYESRSSGGGWWLTDDDWRALENAGWAVAWDQTRGGDAYGPLATRASRRGVTFEEALAEFEKVTGQHAHEPGCQCSHCGRPHHFTLYDMHGRIAAGTRKRPAPSMREGERRGVTSTRG